MCGLVGVVNREKVILESTKLDKIFNQLLYADALRGTHGTGILSVTDKKEVLTLKKALPASDFLDLGRYKNIVERNNNIFLLGHNRFATQGSHTSTNAHPFNHGDIHLFHNGTLHGHNNLSKNKNFDVDSDALAFFISDQDDTVKALESINGAYSLVWYDEYLETLNFARNKERPMFVAILDSGSIIYASEKDMLLWVCGRNGLNISKDLFELEVGKWLQVPFDGAIKPTLTSFTPKEEDDFELYSNYSKWYTSNKSASKTIKTSYKYTYLEGSTISITPSTWTPYTPNNFTAASFGYLSAWLYEEQLEIRMSSIVKSKADELLGKEQKIKFTSCVNDNLIWATLLPSSDTNSKPADNKQLTITKLNTKKDAYYVSDKDFLSIIKNGCSLCCCTILPSETAYIENINKVDIVLCEDCAKEYDDYTTKLEAYN